jgi:hypothetical protein
MPLGWRHRDALFLVVAQRAGMEWNRRPKNGTRRAHLFRGSKRGGNLRNVLQDRFGDLISPGLLDAIMDHEKGFPGRRRNVLVHTGICPFGYGRDKVERTVLCDHFGDSIGGVEKANLDPRSAKR